MRFLLLAQTDNLTPARDVVWWSFYVLLSLVAVFELVSFMRGKEKATKSELEQLKRAQHQALMDHREAVHARLEERVTMAHQQEAELKLLTSAFHRQAGEVGAVLAELRNLPASIRQDLQDLRKDAEKQREKMNAKLESLNAKLVNVMAHLPEIRRNED